MQFVRRPWGWHLTLLTRKRYKIKLLKFRAGKSISKQRHEMRNELWLFLRGAGHTLGGDRKYAGDFYHIRQGSWHKFRAGRSTLVLEVQYGILCEEGDIERV